MDSLNRCTLLSVTVSLLIVSIQAITVSPLCPTNKIAPHRRIASYNQYHGRTFGAFYDLLAPNHPNNEPYNDLQEQPQEDDPNDCGEIEDYDENDLSSLTYQSQRRREQRGHHKFIGLFSRPHYSPPVTPHPQKPTYPPSRPPFSSGGYFGNNPYRPQPNLHPSEYVKPVHESNSQQFQEIYTPNVVGGSLNYVVGVSPVKPTREPTRYEATSARISNYYPYRTEPTPMPLHASSQPLRKHNQNGIFGSFIDLLFK